MTDFMDLAIEEARKAAAHDDVPIGAVIVRNGEVIASCGNRREEGSSAILHAETEAIHLACQKLGRWRLSDCELYVTMEPCPMCAGAIVNARIPKVVYGVKDYKAGAFGSVLNLNAYPLNHKVCIEGGVKEEVCLEILQEFFKRKRNEK